MILSANAGFLSMVWVTHFTQFEKFFFKFLFISSSNGSVFLVFIIVKPYILLFQRFYRVCFAAIYFVNDS